MHQHYRRQILVFVTLLLGLSGLSCGGGSGPEAITAGDQGNTDVVPGGDYPLDVDERDLSRHDEECNHAWARNARGGRGFFGPNFFVVDNEDGTTTRDLFIRHDDVGSVTVTIEGDTLTATFEVDEAFGLDSADLFVGTRRPFGRRQNNFQYRASDLEGAQTHTFTVDLAEDFPEAGERLFLAAHAVVCADEDPGNACEGASLEADLGDPEVGVEYNERVEVVGYDANFRFELTGGTLPSGLHVTPSGRIVGTPDDPDQAGDTFTFEITATERLQGNREGCTVTGTFTFTLGPDDEECEAAPEITTTELPGAVTGDPFSAQVLATGGEGDLTFSVSAGELPGGLTLDPATGTIAGTPTDPAQTCTTVNFTVMVTDECPQGAQTDTAELSIAVGAPACDPLSITTRDLDNPVLNEAFNATIETSGGAGNLTFALVGGALPTGLTLNADGTISGTATEVGEVGTTFEFTVEVTDECLCEPQTAQATFSVTLGDGGPDCAPAPTITTTELPPATTGVPYLATVVATGGEGTLTFSLGKTTLPSGLTLDPATGVISGIPDDPAETCTTVGFTVTVTDQCETNQFGSADLSIEVGAVPCDPIRLATEDLPDPILGLEYAAALVATGGSGTLTFTMLDGSLPAGITLNADGTLTGTATEAGEVGQEFTFTVEVRDECLCEAQTIQGTFSISLVGDGG
ncbi:MAG TPA: Ig domain-containing protein [bacterium]|nr:Ig domain-containing protein [bacterium]